SVKTVGIYNNVQVDVLNFMFHINRKIAVGAAVKFRTITNVDDIDPKLAFLAENSLDYAQLWDQDINETLLDVNHMAWMEYGLIYSQVLKEDGEHFMKMGVKAKWLSGYTAAYLHTSNLSYNLFDSDSTNELVGDFSYGHSTGILNGEVEDGEMPEVASKFGLGLDLGFIYEWRPDWKDYKYDMDGETNIWRRDQDKYKIRVGASILDIGGMKFAKGGLSQDFSVNQTTGFFDLNTFDVGNGIVGLDSVITDLVDNDPNWTPGPNDADNTFFMQLPTAVSLQFDYHIYKWFYVNATGNLNVQNRKNPHRVRTANQFSITPSFDHAWFGLHLPFMMNKYSGFKSGIGVRLGPLTIGVNDWNVLFASGKKIRGAQAYAGLRVPVLYGHPSDIDGDLVSDAVDECEVVPGLWEFKGCPDSDRDGIPDIDDHCPQEAGLAEFNGCPDKDKDGIPDKDDACPGEPGAIQFFGCPDRDNDSIIDSKDDCPDTPGLPAFKGCPDTDGDGIKDEDDACPEVPGPLVNNGCPDTDNDGLFDFIDECPTVYGPKENNGCPWPDTDEDGLLDKDDKCPYIAGPKENEGCPYSDTDGDGVLDKDDDCPATPGPVENKGCPKIEEEVAEILKTAFENLEFETGKAIIKTESLPSLTELAEVLVKKPEWKLQISGHTDNVGNDQNNLVLSKKRSEAVRDFMVSKGITIDRLSALYFGETQPKVSNDTKEGRQTNRRVEMVIIFN
ncbi:MAG: OmpA family protein, partial [Crocinitomicaceae bacterium]|nr:OmpA family protein [Crocinitomicaceae bacterium]